MSRKPKLDQRLLGVVPNRARLVQIALRWLSVVAGALVAVQVGRAIDLLADVASVPGLWWAQTAFLVTASAASEGLATAQSLRTQALAERSLREESLKSWFSLGSVSVSRRQGELLDLASTGAVRAARYRAGFLSASVASLSAPLLIVVVMGLSLGWRVALPMASIVTVGPLVIGAFQGMNRDVGDRFRQSQSHLRESFLEGIRGLESLSYAGAGDAYLRRLAETNELHRRRIMRLLASNQVLIFVMDLVFSLAALLLATFLAVHGQMSGSLTLGQSVTLVLLTLMLVAPVDLIGQFFYIGIGGRAASRQFSKLFAEADRSTVTSDPEQEIPADLKAGAVGRAVVLSGVTAGWDEGSPVLRQVNLRVAESEHLAVVGPSGEGKSTLSAVIQGLIVPTDGHVLVSGKAPNRSGGSRLPIAVVEQRAYLFNGSVADNLRLAKPDATEEELWQALEQANLAEAIRELPGGLQSVVGDHGSRLSGGQAQRLAIARALLKDAPILILDEPTSQVDLRSEAAILEAIDRACQGRSVITIAHRAAAARGAQRTVQLKGGQILPLEEADDE